VITYSLIAITVVASFYAWSNPSLFAKLMMNPYEIERKQQYYRFLTSGFIHKDHMHLFFNMFSFYFFGLSIEVVFHDIFGSTGNIYFVLLYLLAIIVSDIPSYLKHKNNPGYNSLGASGGVSAIVFVFILFKPLQWICIYIALCMPGFILGALFIAFSYYQGRKGKGTINHSAHLYGALFGLLFCLIVYPESVPAFTQQVTAQINEWLGF
jgi:membrane associated rhomboid family serine protease